MAVQQRIIGGGLLLAGIAVVLILIFLFMDKGVPWDEAYAKLRKEIYPAYLEAERKGDYVGMQRIAEEALALEKETTMASVVKEARADAVKPDLEAQGLVKLLDEKAFEKNLEGLYALDGGWFDSRTHAALRLLKDSLGDAMPSLIEARRTARKTAEVLEELRVGSGLALAAPAPSAQGASPVAAADAALFAVFGVRPDDVRKALATKGEGQKAKSARLVWNQADATDTRQKLVDSLSRIPALAESIERAAVALGKSERDVKAFDAGGEGAKRAEGYWKAAASQLAAGLEGEARAAAETDASIASIAEALMQDARTLKGHLVNAPSLGEALAGSFAP